MGHFFRRSGEAIPLAASKTMRFKGGFGLDQHCALGDKTTSRRAAETDSKMPWSRHAGGQKDELACRTLKTVIRITGSLCAPGFGGQKDEPEAGVR